jgi:predicted amidophosphoribosyltransferase
MWLRFMLFPSRCAVCGAPGAVLCGGCRSRLRPTGPIRCGRCGAPTVVAVERCRECSGRRLAFASARAAVVYDAGARALVRAWKEQSVRLLAPAAAQLIVDALARPEAAALAAVPADPERGLRRGTHPAEQLAALLAEAWELPLDRSLVRATSLPRQRGLDVAARRQNVRDAFTAVAPPPRTLVLVDDVYTTGATVDAAARALRRAGTRRVDVITFARVSRLH